MKKTSIVVCTLLLTLVGGAVAQSALSKAEADLRLAQAELSKLKEGILEEESVLIGEVEKRDEEVETLTRQLSKLLEEETSLAGRQRKLDEEIAARKGEFEFTLSSLRSYSRGLVNRLQGAEVQHEEPLLDASELRAQTAGDDLTAEVEARVEAIAIGAKRLQAASGGARFAGKAVGPGNVIREGRFVVAGPLGYFASADGSLTGFTTVGGGDSKLPGVATIAADAGGAEIASLVETGAATVPVDASMGKALQMARSKKSMADYLAGGGVVGYGIVLLGLVAFLIALFKLIEIQHFPVPGRQRINEILDDLLEDRVPAAQEKASRIPGLSGDLTMTGVKFFFDKRRILEDAFMEKLSTIQPRLDRFLPFLALVAAAAPMMGLLGTVLGIMKTFAMMSASGTGDSRAFSAGISEALITTAEGLIVAIPVIVIHGMLKSLAKAKFGQMEGVALSFLNGTTEIVARPAAESTREDGGDDDLDEQELAPA